MKQFLTLLVFVSCSAYSEKCYEELASLSKNDRYEITKNTVVDTETHLEWARYVDGRTNKKCVGCGNKYTWKEALDRANSFKLNGKDDWRLPNIKELRSILELNCNNAAINYHAFPNTPNLDSWHWTSSPMFGPNVDKKAWATEFGQGASMPYDKKERYYIRLVRGGL